MNSLPVDRPIAEQRVCDVIAGFPDAEDVLEQAGVDYWFRSDDTVGAVCQTAHADPGEVESRLATCRRCAHGDSPPAMLAALLRESDEHWRQRLEPAIDTAMTAAGIERHPIVLRLLQELKRRLVRHMATSRSLLSAAEAIERAEAGVVQQNTLRTLRLDHLELARLARSLRAYADTSADDADLRDALRNVIHEVHHHLRVAYDFILPRLVAAALSKPAAFEAW